MSNKPMMFDLFCGLGGATQGFLDEGYDCIGIDNERHVYGEDRYPAQLWIQDILTIYGSQLRHADFIWASPPCTEFSYLAMPWSRGKQIARALRGCDDFPDNYKGSRTIQEMTALFDACFRIQREAIEAAGHHIPMIVENVRGAQEWVGRSRAKYGSFHLYGDVPAIMPATSARKTPVSGPLSMMWSERVSDANHPFADAFHHKKDGIKQSGISGTRDNGKGDKWFQDGAAQHGSKSNARKSASAMIAKIPLALSRHIAKYWKPI